MTRGFIVGEIPPACWRCSLYECGCMVKRENGFFKKTAYDIDQSKERPSWCPIKKMPRKITVEDIDDHTDPLLVKMGYVSGWNDCLSFFFREEVENA